MDHTGARLEDDPEWQEVLRASRSPAPPPGRNSRLSPSATAGASQQSTEAFYLTAGFSSDEDWGSIIEDISAAQRIPVQDVQLPGTRGRNGEIGSARTSPAYRSTTNTLRTSPTPHSNMSPIAPGNGTERAEEDQLVVIDDGEIICIPGASQPSQQDQIDLDMALAMSLQREWDAEGLEGSIEYLEMTQPMERPPPASTATSRAAAYRDSQVPRYHVPTGPQRGATGVIPRHRGTSNVNTSSSSTIPRPRPNLSESTRRTPTTPIDLITPPTLHRSADNSMRRPSSISRELPPISRFRSTPLSPAHTPVAPVGLPRASTTLASTSTRAARPDSSFHLSSETSRAPQPEEWDDEVQLIETDDLEDRLRRGAMTRPGIASHVRRPIPAAEPPLDEFGQVDFYRLVNGRPFEGPGSRQDALARDIEYNQMLQEAIALDDANVQQELANEARANQRGGRGRHRHAYGRRFGRDRFEIDTTDYEALLRLDERAPPVKRGTSSAILAALPIVKAPNDDCTICQGTAESAMVKLPCFHTFHKECITPHLKSNRFCPNCRHEIE